MASVQEVDDEGGLVGIGHEHVAVGFQNLLQAGSEPGESLLLVPAYQREFHGRSSWSFMTRANPPVRHGGEMAGILPPRHRDREEWPRESVGGWGRGARPRDPVKVCPALPGSKSWAVGAFDAPRPTL